MIITTGSKVKDLNGNTYLLVEDIGQGGFGCVYKATRESDGKEFAVKTLLHSFADSEAVFAFQNEISSAEKIKGENIISYEYIHNGETFADLPPYIIMEYAKGGTLKQQLQQRKETDCPYEKNELISIYKQLINGMKIINSKLVHRDIKPENILIQNGELKISDFGLAKVATEATRSLSLKGYGTLPYTAPEAWNNGKNTIQMDIYSMGIVFFELATLEYPYAIKAETIEDYKKAHLFSAVKSVDLLKKRTSPVISSIILRMLEKPTQRRFSNWDEIEEQLSKETIDDSAVTDIVMATISTRLQRETEKQKKIAKEQQEKEEKDTFCQLVRSQFEAMVLEPIKQFQLQYDSQNSSVDKCRYHYNVFSQDKFQAKLEIPAIADISIKCKVILPNSEMREMSRYGYGGSYIVNYTPKLQGKDIIGWVEIENRDEYGFNLLLVKTDGLYGDWLILNNENNLSRFSTNCREMPEPFAFSIDSLSEALKSIECTSMYSSTPIEYTEKEFLTFFSKLLK